MRLRHAPRGELRYHYHLYGYCDFFLFLWHAQRRELCLGINRTRYRCIYVPLGWDRFRFYLLLLFDLSGNRNLFLPIGGRSLRDYVYYCCVRRYNSLSRDHAL